jgi:protein-tyrosine phosphatase/arsenate reductase
MFNKIETLVNQLINRFDEIAPERKAVLNRLSNYISEKKLSGNRVNLVYICTHNSRRSHFGQIAAAVAAVYYNFDNIYTYSGGTEATAFNKNAVMALKNLGFVIESLEPSTSNPIYQVMFGQNKFTNCFSKLYDDNANPKLNFAAIMTCSEAEQNCPIIDGAEVRIGTTYKDPKEADNTAEVFKVYEDRFKQIATETLYAFSQSLQKQNK